MRRAAGHENLLLTASTASGKTEAAFFPIITLFSENPPTSVGCIYIGPLKALINDQFRNAVTVQVDQIEVSTFPLCFQIGTVCLYCLAFL